LGKSKLIGHILENRKEVGIAKGNTYDAELKWKKRQWNISPEIKNDCFIVDRKGITHCWLDVNQADGTYHFLTPEKLNLYTSARDVIDKCGECGGQISIDAQEHRIVNRKNIIKSFWGLDNSYMLLILLLGIVCVILVGALFFVVGELNKTNTLLQKYLAPVPQTVTSKFILPFVGAYQ
jgi:hypothetical protein